MTVTVYKNDGSPKAAQTQLVGDAPAGSIMAYGGAAIPTDWLVCDGTAVVRAAYPDLFNAIGTIWGSGNGTTTFNLPDLRNRMLYGPGTRTLGTRSQTDPTLANPGEETHTLVMAEAAQKNGVVTAGQSVSHSHIQHANTVYADVGNGVGFLASSGPRWASAQGGTYSTDNASADHTHTITGSAATTPHNNMPPYAIVNWIIRAIPPYKTANLVAPTAIQRVTSLPGSPVDGQEVYYVADATNGVLWHLKYNAGSASAYKWEVVGGSSLHVEDNVERSVTSTTQAAVGACSINTPLAGDYRVTGSVAVELRTANGFAWNYIQAGVANVIYMSLVRGAATTGVRLNGAVTRTIHQAGLAVGAVCTMQHASDGSNPAFLQARSLDLLPVRVG